ncbi:unnamed protein product [Neospora caninum Liverpool]|uniref:Toxoplasma gondii family A protein n=1 Tax=Neospora caninum (strain Liverpool) TaxID=572307 RepID=F0VE63_NEOCL|nr:uncharacterized protein NCLIV_017970 [Neospora caninum Liverpool]CBZ52007.1 unnamed protein product [Neospora caninum Liverpool]CEL65968.1 TPA: hypothetical protein BN1204_017970 [Neospora caninum Liverpool]|eukprot:XP_003882039.1 uncharacterized protein NCLIV_017970 [Neospora caninum Liverpool]
MERHALQIVLLAFLLAAAVPCAASEVSGAEPKPNFTVTISKEGITENSQREFSLGPSATLRVVDETGKATLLPAPSTDAASEAGQYSVAYVFENGQCNFEKTVAYKDAFPGYSEELWVRTGTEAGTEKESAGEVGNYTFTNPPDEYLSGGVSFCVRFTTATSTTTPFPTAAPTLPTVQTPSSSEDSSSGSGGGEGSSTDRNNEASDGVAQSPKRDNGHGDTNAGEEPKEPEATGGPKEAEEDHDQTTPVVVEDVAGSFEKQTTPIQIGDTSASTLTSSSGERPGEAPEGAGKGTTVSDATDEPKTAHPSGATTQPNASVENAKNEDAHGDVHRRLRRLSGTEASEVKHLTIVVHSAASGSTAGTLTLSAALLALTASLLSSF